MTPPAKATTAASTTTPRTSSLARTAARPPLRPNTNVPARLRTRMSVGLKPSGTSIAPQGSRRPRPSRRSRREGTTTWRSLNPAAADPPPQRVSCVVNRRKNRSARVRDAGARYPHRSSGARLTVTRPLGGRQALSLTFRDLTCLPLIRRWLRSNLPPDEDLELDAELVCCELVTNAVEHGGGVGAVRIDIIGDEKVRVEVDDK